MASDDAPAALYALTPLDGRYAGRVSKIRDYFSEAALIKASVRVEVEYLASLSQVIPALGDVFEGDGLATWRAVSTNFGPADAPRVKTIAATARHLVRLSPSKTSPKAGITCERLARDSTSSLTLALMSAASLK